MNNYAGELQSLGRQGQRVLPGGWSKCLERTAILDIPAIAENALKYKFFLN